MAKRKLRNLYNLGKYAIANTAKTVKEKARKLAKRSTDENAPILSPKVKRRLGRPKKHGDTRVETRIDENDADTPHTKDASQTREPLKDTRQNAYVDSSSVGMGLGDAVSGDEIAHTSIDDPTAHDLFSDIFMAEPTQEMVPALEDFSDSDDEYTEASLQGKTVPTFTPQNNGSCSESILKESDPADFEDLFAHDSPPEKSGDAEVSDDEDNEDGGRSDLEDYCTPGWGQRRGESRAGTSWDHRKPPTEKMALDALAALEGILHPRKGVRNRVQDAQLNKWTEKHLKEMEVFFRLYTSESSSSRGHWMDASVQAATAMIGGGKRGGSNGRYGHARGIRERAKQFVLDGNLPENPFGKWVKSRLQPDTEFAHDLQIHLLSCGKYVRSQDIVDYLTRPDVQQKFGLKKTVSLATAKRWMGQLGYRFVRNHTGQYVDGHERDDVVYYRQSVFLPAWFGLDGRMKSWTRDNVLELAELIGRPVVVWFHDESIFYAHDRKKSQWIKQGDSPTPYAKGEGVSLMVADFVSADYGWLKSKDGKRSARVVFRPGKNRDGYFDNEDIVAQAQMAMDILESDYPDEEHILVYDNATTHLKRAANAPSASKMPKNTPKNLQSNWGVSVPMKGSNGQPVYDENGKKRMQKVRMADGEFNGKPYSFYFPEIDPETGMPHVKAGLFKGMVTILQERGYGDWSKTRFECEGFKCDPSKNGECCCRRKLYNEPDMVNGKSVLETTCEERNFRVLFLPKFHCELNPIEQCWGRAKRHYRLLPVSSKEEDLERNMIESLEKIELLEIRRFSRRSRRFMDAYRKGLDGKIAAWAAKKYRGHRCIPENILQVYNDEQNKIS